MKPEEIRLMLEITTSVEAAQHVMNRYGNFKTTEEKVQFLNKIFDFEIANETSDETLEKRYEKMLKVIVKSCKV